MEIVKVDINELISPEYNPRQITDDEMEKLKNSINEFGYIAPIIVNKHNNHIIGGNQRYEALKSLGYTDVDVVFVDEPDLNREKALNIALNKISGEWDFVKLADIIDELELNDFDIPLTGFDDSELENFGIEEDQNEHEPVEVAEDDYEEHDELEVTVQTGDIYILGNHRLMCGDSTKTEDVALLMEGKQADMVFTDPPYDLEDNYSTIIFKNAKANAEIFIMTNERKLAHIIVKYDKYFRRLFAVDFKVARLINSNAPMTQVDFIGHFRKEPPTTFNNLNDHFTTLIESPKTSKTQEHNFNHKHCKNITLPSEFIKHFSNEKENILDLFGGSGSTMMACEQLNRNCYMMELSPHYCQVIIDRWEQFTGKKALKLN